MTGIDSKILNDPEMAIRIMSSYKNLINFIDQLFSLMTHFTLFLAHIMIRYCICTYLDIKYKNYIRLNGKRLNSYYLLRNSESVNFSNYIMWFNFICKQWELRIFITSNLNVLSSRHCLLNTKIRATLYNPWNPKFWNNGSFRQEILQNNNYIYCVYKKRLIKLPKNGIPLVHPMIHIPRLINILSFWVISV